MTEQGQLSSRSTSTLANSNSNPATTERTPLIPKSHSVTIIPTASAEDEGYGDESDDGPKGREVEVYKPGKSSFTQTLLNVLGDLIGTGLLALPIAAAHAGWLLGGLFLLLMAAGTLWTLKILIRIIERDRRLRSFTDVVGHGLGPRVQYWLTCFFILEFLVWNVALVVLASDSLEAVIPRFSSDQWKLLCLIVVLPLSFVPLRFLAFSSFLGVLTTWGIIAILCFSGIATEHAPGSLREPMPTSVWPAHGWVKLGTTFGLIAAGFGGHGLIPNLVHDMAKPRQADRVVEVAYAIAMTVNVIVSVSGYLMYGTEVSDEVSRDLARTPGFSPTLNWLAVLMVGLNPLTKLPLSLRPLSDIIFTLFHLHPAIYVPNSVPTPRYVTRPNSPAPSVSSATSDPCPGMDTRDLLPLDPEEAEHERWERRKRLFRPVIRVILAVLAVAGGVLLPSFESVMSLLGSGFALVTVMIIPLWAGAELFGWTWYAMFTMGLSGVVAVIGILTAFWPGQATSA